MSGDYHLFSEKTVSAAKPHRCIWCGEGIAKGEMHLNEKSVYDGAFQDHRWHPECKADAQQCFEGEGDCEFIPWSAPRPERPAQQPQGASDA